MILYDQICHHKSSDSEIKVTQKTYCYYHGDSDIKMPSLLFICWMALNQGEYFESIKNRVEFYSLKNKLDLRSSVDKAKEK